MPLREINLETKSVDKSNIDKFDKGALLGKENTPAAQQSIQKSIQGGSIDKTQERLQNYSSSPNSSTSEEIVFVPDITIYPMDSKVDFGVVEDNIPIFSPPYKSGKIGSVQVPIPNFFSKLEPKKFAEIRKRASEDSCHQSQPFKKARQEKDAIAETSQQLKTKQANESVADSIVQHVLNTNHLYFPGKCHFVSLKITYYLLCIKLFCILFAGEWALLFLGL